MAVDVDAKGKGISLSEAVLWTITNLQNHYCVSPLPRCDSHLKVNTVIILLSLQKKNKYWLMIYFLILPLSFSAFDFDWGSAPAFDMGCDSALAYFVFQQHNTTEVRIL